MSQGTERLGDRGGLGSGWLVRQPEGTHSCMKLTVLYGHGSGHHATITAVTSKIPGHRHHSKYNSNEKFEVL